jgi:hypothetical protein
MTGGIHSRGEVIMPVHQTPEPERGQLAAWVAAQRRVGPRRFRQAEPGGLRFAFYGRISTTDHQDHGSSRHWQITAASDLIAGHGCIVAEFRVSAAMRVQARDQGRYLGGRPPYGYRLVDAGPHPNAAHARWGRRLHRLEPDPATAPHVRWMSAQRLAGHSVAGIARRLNEMVVACPSEVDPGVVDRQPARHLPPHIAAHRVHRLGIGQVLQGLQDQDRGDHLGRPSVLAIRSVRQKCRTW